VCLAWVFFRSETFGGAIDMLGRIGSLAGGPSPLVTGLVLATIVAMLASQWVPARVIHRADDAFAGSPLAVHALALAGGLVVIDALGPEGVAPFIYFQF
jgi:hypothetical protein